MMNKLAKEHCVACRPDSPRVTDAEMKELLPQIPYWKVVEREGVPRLERTYKLKDFVQALAFTNKVGDLAEAADHHPVLCTEYGKTTTTWWTHAIKGLHRNDFIMAAKCDELYEASPKS
jgi:4a-hydroxytetrahydrobiopterin dehydratase